MKATPVSPVIRMEKINKRKKMQELKSIIVFILVLGIGQTLQAQSEPDFLQGEVSYKSSQTIYVKFASTEDIAIGDTLFIDDNGFLIPILTVKNKSSISCIGTALSDRPIEIGTSLRTGVKKKEEPPMPVPVVIPQEEIVVAEKEETGEVGSEEETKAPVGTLKGRVTAAAYFNIAENSLGNKQRMRYTLSMNGNRINGTRFSLETYMSFRHTANEWEEVQQDFHRAFKVYNLAMQYESDNGLRLWAGRKINYSISNIGAIDGVQAEKKWNTMLVGAFVGSRPDISDYTYNPKLNQYGLYVGHQAQGKNGFTNSSMALVEQKNNGMTDRRFIYFQHNNSLIKEINIFTSFEFDLYTVMDGQPKNTLDITSLYFSVRYRPSRKLSFFGSYDARNNIIYYETYKNTIDQLLEDETRQGFRLSFNYQPWKRVSIGSNAGYRYQKDNPSSKNLNNYIRFASVPGIKAAVTASVVLIESAYLRGTVFGLRMSRDIIKGKVFGQLEARKVVYHYNNIEVPVNQSIVGLNLSWRFTRKLLFAINFEGEFKNKNATARVYTNITKRF